jgi:hypothetical protein
MKKLILSIAVITAFALSSCGGKDGEDLSVCDCVNMKDDADDKTKEACKTMEKEWKDKYEKASDEEKKKLQEEVEACEEKK